MSSSGVTHVKRPRYSPEFWLACGDPGCFAGLPHTWLRRVLPQVISTWGSNSPPHPDTQISANNRIRSYSRVCHPTGYMLFQPSHHKQGSFPLLRAKFQSWALQSLRRHRRGWSSRPKRTSLRRLASQKRRCVAQLSAWSVASGGAFMLQLSRTEQSRASTNEFYQSRTSLSIP